MADGRGLPEPEERREWFQHHLAAFAERVAAGPGRVVLGGVQPCPLHSGDARMRIYQWGRMDCFLAGSRAIVASRGGRRQAPLMRPGDVTYWAPEAWAGEPWDRDVRYMGVVFRDQCLRLIIADHLVNRGHVPAQVTLHTARPLGGAAHGVRQALDELADQRDADEVVDRSLVATILRLARAHLLQDEGEPPAGAEATWQQVREEILARADEVIEREDIARAVGITPGYLSELCRERAGRTFRQLLEEVRMERARRLLRSRRDLSVAEVAEHCGYRSAGYFGRAFRRAMGVTPGCYRAG